MPKKDKRAWAWLKLKECHDNSTPVTVRASQVVKGGLTVHATEIGGLRGFIPASHLELRHVSDLSAYVGQVFLTLVDSIDMDRKKVVFSRRVLLKEDGKRRVADAISGLEVGTVLDGVVSNITDSGMFVTAGDIYGLVDSRAVSWNVELDFRQARSLGEKVRARVLRVRKDKGHVAFDIRDTEPDPWLDHARTHKVGQLVFGRAVSVLPHCAYFEISWGVYGYAHISELSDEVPDRATDVVSPGDEMWLKLIGHDPRSRYDQIVTRMFPAELRRGGWAALALQPCERRRHAETGLSHPCGG